MKKEIPRVKKMKCEKQKGDAARKQFLGVSSFQTRQSSLHLLHKKLNSLKGQSSWELGYN